MTRDELYERVLAYGSDSLGVFGGRYEGGVRLQQNPEEFADFLFLLQNYKIEKFLELGAAQGGVTKVIHELIGAKELLVVDNQSHRSGAVHRVENLAGIRHMEVIGNVEDRETILLVSRCMPTCDLLLIDADHESPAPLRDYNNYACLVREGGLLSFHDTLWADGVREAISHIRAYQTKRWKEVGCFESKCGLTVFERL